MVAHLKWAEFDYGYMGLLSCGLTIVVERIQTGKYAGGYHARFGAARCPGVFWHANDAKRAGIDLARIVLTDCLLAIESGAGQ